MSFNTENVTWQSASDSVYVECCQRQVPRAWAMPFYYADRSPVYLCQEGRGCTVAAS